VGQVRLNVPESLPGAMKVNGTLDSSFKFLIRKPAQMIIPQNRGTAGQTHTLAPGIDFRTAIILTCWRGISPGQ